MFECGDLCLFTGVAGKGSLSVGVAMVSLLIASATLGETVGGGLVDMVAVGAPPSRNRFSLSFLAMMVGAWDMFKWLVRWLPCRSVWVFDTCILPVQSTGHLRHPFAELDVAFSLRFVSVSCPVLARIACIGLVVSTRVWFRGCLTATDVCFLFRHDVATLLDVLGAILALPARPLDPLRTTDPNETIPHPIVAEQGLFRAFGAEDAPHVQPVLRVRSHPRWIGTEVRPGRVLGRSEPQIVGGSRGKDTASWHDRLSRQIEPSGGPWQRKKEEEESTWHRTTKGMDKIPFGENHEGRDAPLGLDLERLHERENMCTSIYLGSFP